MQGREMLDKCPQSVKVMGRGGVFLSHKKLRFNNGIPLLLFTMFK